MKCTNQMRMHLSFIAIIPVTNFDITLPHLVLFTSWTQDNRNSDIEIQGISPIGLQKRTSAILYDSLAPSFIGCSYLTVTFAVSDFDLPHPVLFTSCWTQDNRNSDIAVYLSDTCVKGF